MQRTHLFTVTTEATMAVKDSSEVWYKIIFKLECWQLTCQFPTCRSPVLCRFDRDNSMYEQQT